MNLVKKVLGATAILLCSTAALAAPITTNVGQATILGTEYNVSVLYDTTGQFTAQSFNELMPNITFTTLNDAQAAATALLATFPSFDWNPGRAGPSGDGGRIAFEVGASDYRYVTIREVSGGPFGPFVQSLTGNNNFSFIQFSAAQAVPAPSALALLGLGLLGLRLGKRQRG